MSGDPHHGEGVVIGSRPLRLLQRVPRVLRRLSAPISPRRSMGFMVSDHEENIRRQVALNYGGGFSHAYDEFRRLAERLAQDDSIEARPLTELDATPPSDSRRVFLRIDVDADPWTGVRMARDLAALGVAGNIYLLHTASYYGFLAGGTFVRHGWMPRVVRELVVSGIEIGVHNDVMGLAGKLADARLAASVFREEIEWLRSLGAAVRGTVGHNSIRGYGAENSEVFNGRRLMPDRLDARRSRLPIGLLREGDLGLEYEGTGAMPRPAGDLDRDAVKAYVDAGSPASIRDETWMRLYLLENPLHDWRTDHQVWALGGGRWGIAGRSADGSPEFCWGRSIEEVLDWMGRIHAGSRTMFVLHPEYFAP